MATNILFKNYTCSTRKEFLQKIYDTLASDPNWTVIHEEGGYDTSSPADGDYFVVECDAGWADDGSVHQQLLFCANDNSTTTKTFGGSAGNKWTILDDSISVIYSPDGGWNGTTKEFSDNAGSLVEKQIDWDPSTTATPGLTMSAATTANAIMWWGIEASTQVGGFAGELDTTDSDVEDPRPCAVFWGYGHLSPSTSYSWAHVSNVAGYTPNQDRDGWYSAVSDSSGTRIDTYGQAKQSGAWVQWPLPVYSVSPARMAGTFGIIKRISTSVAAGDENADHTRVVLNGITFPWSGS